MRTTVFLLAVTSLTGCGASGPARVAGPGAIGAVSADQQYVALYASPSLLPDHGLIGSLSIMELGKSGSTELGAKAFGADFGRSGDLLLFRSGPMPSTDTGSKVIYGQLSIWTPALSAPVAVTQGLAVLDATPADHSFVIAFDAPAPMKTQMGTVVLVRDGDCSAAATCKPVTLASNVEVTDLTVSPDGRYAAYVVHAGMGATSQYQAWLVDVTKGAATQVAASTRSNFVALSPDGNLLATGATSGALPIQLTVISTANGQPVAWAAQPMATGTVQAAFTDPQTLYIVARTAQMTSSIYRTTAQAATELVASARSFAIQRQPSGASRYLWASVNGNMNGAFDWQLYDLQAATPMPVMAASAANAPVVSDDLTAARLLESYSDTTFSGDLELLALPAGSATPIATAVPAAGVEFSFGGSKLFWLDMVGGTGTLSEWTGSAPRVIAKNVFDFRTRSSPDRLYFAVSAPDPTSGAGSPGVYSVPLP